jgi:hypothetical protein
MGAVRTARLTRVPHGLLATVQDPGSGLNSAGHG